MYSLPDRLYTWAGRTLFILSETPSFEGELTIRLVQLLIRRPLPGTARVNADAAELVIQTMQIFAQQLHHLHAEVSMLAEEFQEKLCDDAAEKVPDEPDDDGFRCPESFDGDAAAERSG